MQRLRVSGAPAGVQASLVIPGFPEELEDSEIPRAYHANIEIVKNKETYQHCM